MPESLQHTLDFLRDLRANNNRAWFEQNRKRYDAARGHFEAFVAELILSIGQVDDLGGVTVKECVYRINRDVRFSPDKSPYKTNMGAVIGKGGRKSGVRSYYVQVEPGGQSMVAGGLYMPSAVELDRVRRSVARDAAPLRKILRKADFKRGFGSLSGESLKTAPLGYSKDHPEIELLRLKQYLAYHMFSDAEVVAPDWVEQITALCKALKPLLVYLESVVEA
jgi:uncharacterized protein (TIGR02453 family)